MIFIGSAGTAYALKQLLPVPSGAVAGAFAQVGATLLVAYAVHTTWVLQNSPKRGHRRENWVGVASGVGSCAIIGIAFGLALSGQQGSLDGWEQLLFAWTAVSVGFLGLWIALQPWAMYDLMHKFKTEYPDE
ncbi:MAG TPA: hypothetical protein VFS64_05985 [Solirubrobacterales bacterium]|nr:hypothetical protein [Solirubrobacterales bacterium]